MLTALNENKCKIVAWQTEKKEGPFYCDCCGVEMILKKGKVKIHHFSHKKNGCLFGIGESQEHYRIKSNIYNFLMRLDCCSKIAMERYLVTVRPDISFKYKNMYFAIEIQKSDISIDLIRHRNKEYRKQGINLIWILSEKSLVTYYDEDDFLVANVKNWQKYLAACYDGFLYTYCGALLVNTISMEPCHTWIDHTDFGGGYWKKLKKRKYISITRGKYILDLLKERFCV